MCDNAKFQNDSLPNIDMELDSLGPQHKPNESPKEDPQLGQRSENTLIGLKTM